MVNHNKDFGNADCPLLGIATDNNLTVEKFLAMKREDKELECDNVSVRPPFDFGCMEGKICIPDDFNEPLDDFKDYM